MGIRAADVAVTRRATAPKSYTAGLEMHCPGGACLNLGPEIPSYKKRRKFGANRDRPPQFHISSYLPAICGTSPTIGLCLK